MHTAFLILVVPLRARTNNIGTEKNGLIKTRVIYFFIKKGDAAGFTLAS